MPVNAAFQVDYQGATTVKSLDASAGGISNAGAIAGASTGQFTDVLTTADITSSSGKISVPGGIDVAALFTVSAAGAAVASSVSSSTGTGSFGGGISAGNEGFTVGYTGAVTATTVSGSGALSVGAGATFAGAVNLQAGGITNAGSIAGATTISGSGAVTVDSITLGQGWSIANDGDAVLAAVSATTITGSGALSVGAGATFAGAVNLQAGGITNAGAVAGATTIAMGGTLTGATTISGSGALSVGAGATFAGAVNLQAGGITNAGVIAGTTLLTASTGLSGATVYADKFYGDGANISGLTMDPAGSDTNIQFNQNDSLAADTGFYYNGTGSFVVGEGKAFGSNNTGMLSRFTASADAGSGVFGGLYLGSGTINAGSSYIMRSNFGGGVQSIWKEEAGELLLTGSTGIKLQGDMTQTWKVHLCVILR